MSRIRTGEATFDKIAGENERNEVRTVAIWKGARERSEVGLYNLVARPIFDEYPFETCQQRGILLKLRVFYLRQKIRTFYICSLAQVFSSSSVTFAGKRLPVKTFAFGANACKFAP